MLRATFFAAGMFVGLWGISFLFVDQLVLHAKAEEEATTEQEVRGMFMSSNAQHQKIINPPDWVAFSLMSVGSVTMLYSLALPKKNAG